MYFHLLCALEMAAKRREYNKSTALSQAMVDQFDLFLNPNKGNCTILRVNPEGI